MDGSGKRRKVAAIDNVIKYSMLGRDLGGASSVRKMVMSMSVDICTTQVEWVNERDDVATAEGNTEESQKGIWMWN